MPIILFALLVFVLFAFTGVVLLSLALRYRAAISRRHPVPAGFIFSYLVYSIGFRLFLSPPYPRPAFSNASPP